MTRCLVPLLLVSLVLAVGAPSRAATPSSGPAADVRMLAAEMERVHPNLFHAVSRAEFGRAVDDLVLRLPQLNRDQTLVELMRLAALPGPRDGHTGLFPLHPGHRQPLHLLPIRLWDFSDGLFVVAAPGREELVGARLVAIEGTPVADVAALVRPLVSRDNESSLRLRLPGFLVTTEVLHGLGLTRDAASARLTLERGTERFDLTLGSISAGAYVDAIAGLGSPPAPQSAPVPLWLRHRGRTQWFADLDGGRALYAAYTMTTEPTDAFARNLLKRAKRPKVRRVIVDVRLNGGGDNTTYGPLLEALRARVVNLPGRLVVLTGRVTYSAAGNFVAEVDARTRARFVGEAAGGSPHNYGDATQIALPSLGWTIQVATVFHATTGRPDDRLAVEADVPVDVRAADSLAGRDPVLDRAVRPVLAYRAAPPPLQLKERCVRPAERKLVARFTAGDGTRLLGVVLGRGPRGVVLAHQGDATLCSWLPYARTLAARGLRVLVFDHRGYGSSARARTASGTWRVDLDVVAAVKELRRRGARSVVLGGASLGGLGSLAAAPRIVPAVNGVISFSAAASYANVDALAVMPRLRVPVLFLAAEGDRDFAAAAQALHAAAASDEKQLIVVPGTAHGVPLLRNPDVRRAADEFIRAHASG